MHTSGYTGIGAEKPKIIVPINNVIIASAIEKACTDFVVREFCFIKNKLLLF